MRKIIAIALITSFAATGAAMAKTNGGNGQGGQGGQGANGNNGAAPVVVNVVRAPVNRPTYYTPKPQEFCHIAGQPAPTDYECGHNSR